MKTIFGILLIVSFSFKVTYSQTTELSGTITAKETAEPLQNVSVIIPKLFLRTESNEHGKYNLKKIPPGKYNIKFSRLGYKKIVKTVKLEGGKKNILNIQMNNTPIELGEAKVITTRTAKLIKELSVPLEFIGKNKIEESIKTTVSDLMENEPGISVSKDSPWATAVNVRGLSKQNVVYLIDGNRIETSTNLAGGLSLFDLNDIQSIEIVKGGLSSLYGTGATGGVVNIISKQITSTDNFCFNGSLTSGYANVNNGTSNNLFLKASDKYWAIKISGGFGNAGNIKTPAGTIPNSGFKNKSISATAIVFPVDNLNLKINYQNYKAWNVGIPGGAPFPQKASAKYTDASRELIGGTLKIKNLFTQASNVSVKFYRQIINRDVELIPNAKVIIKPGAKHTTTGVLLKYDFVMNGNNYLITGLDVWQREYSGYRTKHIKPLNRIIAEKPVPDSKFKNAGIFLQDEIHLMNKKIKLTLGGRYDFINITNKETDNPVYIINNGEKIKPPANPLASFKAGNENNKSFSGNIGLLYSLNTTTDLTLNAAYTFRSPSLEERFQFIDLGKIQFLGNPKLEPERGTFFDLGLRFRKEKIFFKFNGFINSFNNLVTDKIKIADSLYQKENVGTAKLFGFDASLQYNFYKDNVLYLSAAYVEGKDTETENFLPQIPPLNGKVGLQIPVKNILRFYFSATVYASQNKAAPKEKPTGGYVYYDFKISSEKINFWKTGVKVFCGIENIFNKKYRNHLSTYRGINLFEPGRNIYLKFKVML